MDKIKIKSVIEHFVSNIVPFVRRGGIDNNIEETGVSIFLDNNNIDIRYNIQKNMFSLEYFEDFNNEALDFKASVNYLIFEIVKILQRTKDAYSGCGKEEDMYYLYSLLTEKCMKNEEIVTCCVCNKECIKDPDCKDNWLCPDSDCEVHKEI